MFESTDAFDSCLLVWIIGAVFLYESIHSPLHTAYLDGTNVSISALLSSGFGTSNTHNIIALSKHATLAANALLANTPQLIVSLLYLLYNDCFTRMLLAYEYSKFASDRKALRVSSPRGQQRSTFWLQLPYRYILPIMTAMVLLHWLISRSIFLVQLKVFDISGKEALGRGVNACGFSPLALMLALLLSGSMVVVLAAFRRFRRLDSGMPVASSCSIAMSAAAQPSGWEDVDMDLLPLQYGVILDNRVRDKHGRKHVGFSSNEVGSLASSVTYF